MEFVHKSVLLNEVIEGLDIKENGTYVDGTLGGAGHAMHVCEKLGKDGRFIGIDQDEDAIEASTKRLEKYGDIDNRKFCRNQLQHKIRYTLRTVSSYNTNKYSGCQKNQQHSYYILVRHPLCHNFQFFIKRYIPVLQTRRQNRHQESYNNRNIIKSHRNFHNIFKYNSKSQI